MRSLTVILSAAVLAVLGLCSGCGGRSQSVVQPDSVYIADVYRIMYEYGRTDSAGRDSLRMLDSAQVRAFMSVVGETPVTDLRMQGWSWSLPAIMFTPPVDSVFRSGSQPLAEALGIITARMRAAGVELTPRSYGAVVWGRLESVMFVDSVMLVALNHYLGAEYPGYDHFPLYMRLVKEPEQMPYDVAEAMIATDHPYSNEGGTLLARMLYEGALTLAKMEAVGDDGSDPARALGYRPEQLQFILDNEKNLWQRLVADGLLYDTNTATVDRLIAPAPNSPLLDARCPGRVGRFFGYRIVREYLRRNPEAALPRLLSPDFYLNGPEVLAQSHYNP